MKIIIVGAGISGLGCAVAMKKYLLDHQRIVAREKILIKIYDKPDTSIPDTPITPVTPFALDKPYNDFQQIQRRLKHQGAAISLQQNALRVLADLDPDLAKQITDAGYPCTHFTWKTAGNWVLGRRWFDVLLPISRPMLVRVLMDRLIGDGDGSVDIGYKSVVGVKLGRDQKPIVMFDDDTQEEADLVVGADGIHSVVRKSLFPASVSGESEMFQPQYLGQCGVGGVFQKSTHAADMAEDSAITFVVDSSGVFGYCPIDKADRSRTLFFSFYDSELPPRGTKADRYAISADLRKRHANWSDPVVRDCVSNARLDNVWPTFYMPKLPHWGHHGVVLIGDAAHAMPPSTGQGGSQALEDGQTLGLLLASFLDRDKETLHSAIENTITGFYNVRHERVEGINAKGLRLREPTRPWSLRTRLTIFLMLWLIMKVEYIRRWWGCRDPILEWNVRAEVEKHLASC